MKSRIAGLFAGLCVVLGAGSAFAIGTPCDPCWGNKTGCSSYFVQSCDAGLGFAYYKSKSTTAWLSKCSDGTYYTNTDCKNSLSVKGVLQTNLCKVACTSVGG